MDKVEKRSGFTNTDFVTEAKPNEKALIIRGYAIVFDSPTTVYDKRNGLYEEIIKKEALDNTDLSDVYLLYGHDYNKVLGHTRANLRLEVDDVGLFYECELPNTRDARDVYKKKKKRNYLNREQSGSIVDGNSFGFFAIALAMATLCCSPPDNCDGKLFILSFSPTFSITSSGFKESLQISVASSTFSLAVRF